MSSGIFFHSSPVFCSRVARMILVTFHWSLSIPLILLCVLYLVIHSCAPRLLNLIPLLVLLDMCMFIALSFTCLGSALA